jgi:nicotinamide riboside kinase
MNKSRKKKVLWIGGKASAGKSFFIRRLREIFSGDEVTWRGEYLPVRYSTRDDIKTQLVTCEEFNFHTALGPQTVETTKLMFEG